MPESDTLPKSGKHPFSRLNPLFWKYKHLMIPGLLFCVISAGFTVLVPMVVREAVDAIPRMVNFYALFKVTPGGDPLYNFYFGGLIVFGGSILALSLLSGLFLFLMRQTIIVGSRHIEYDLRNLIYEHVQKLSARFFQSYSTGDVITRSTSDIEIVRRFVGPAVMYTARSLVIMVVALAVMLIISPTLTGYALIPMPFLAVAIFFMAKMVHSRSDAIQKQYSKLTSRVQEVFSGIRVLKAYARESYEAGMFTAESEEYRRRSMDLVKIESAFRPVFILLIGLSIITVIWIGGLLYAEGRITIGNIAEYMIYVAIMTWPVAALGFVINMIQRAKASMIRINHILDSEPEICDDERTDTSITEISGKISFQNVAYRYPETDTDVLHGITFTAAAGSTLAIVGRTGSGKTTLIELLLRLFDPTEGEIQIDDHDLKTIPVSLLRSATGYVSQDVFLFSDTIANNIAFGRMDATREIVEAAADDADLLENIGDFPEGFETFVGERGITLSGGQKQRTSIARAVVREPNVLILDDALSAVDTSTEARILGNLRKQYGKRTCVIVSHRISAVQDADLILVLDEGTVAESGTHADLVELGGIYSETFRKQQLEAEIEALS